MRFIYTATLVAGLVAVPVAAQAPEILVKPPLAGFVTGYQAAKNGSSMIEQVRKGETIDRWTTMVTTQRFANLARKTTAVRFLTELGQNAEGSCAGARASAVRQVGTASEMRLDCPLNPQTGQPETFIALAIMGKSDLHIVQVAWRLAPSAGDVAWGENYLRGVSLKR